jgi:hypothetical protein
VPPGPICYGRGGSEPTISDANLLLGRLNPAKLLAVDAPVSVDQIATIFVEKLGRKIGVDAYAAAGAVLRIANLKMAGAVRMVSIAKGHDPRDFALFAFGGAGPLHATALARELGIPKVLIPARPGLTNALGCVVADLRHDFVNTLNRPSHARCRSRPTPFLPARSRPGALIAQGSGAARNHPDHPFRRHAVHRPDASAERAAGVRAPLIATSYSGCSRLPISPLPGQAAGNPRPARQPQHVGHRRAPRG